MDKVTRLILKAKKAQNTKESYIAWTLVNPRDEGYAGTIIYYGDVPEAEREDEYVTGQTRDEVAEKVSLLAEKHGQDKVTFIHFNF